MYLIFKCVDSRQTSKGVRSSHPLSTISTIPFQVGIKKLKSCGLVRRSTNKWFMSAFFLLSACYMSHSMHKGLGWTWTHQPRTRQEIWCISLDASGHFWELGNKKGLKQLPSMGRCFFLWPLVESTFTGWCTACSLSQRKNPNIAGCSQILFDLLSSLTWYWPSFPF